MEISGWGWLFLTGSWGLVVGLTIFSFWRALGKKNNKNNGGD